MAETKIAGYQNNYVTVPNSDRKIAGFRKEWSPPAPPEPPERNGDPLVDFRIPWSRLEVGWDVAARAWARAMHVAGIDVRLPPGGPLNDEVRAEVEHLAKRGKDFDLHVLSGSFATARMLGPMIDGLARWSHKKVFHTMFERRNFDPAIAKSLAKLDGVWVPCSANREALEACGLQNVRHFGVPHFDDDPLLELAPPREARTFYWIGSWSPHKSPDNLIRAFLRAFKPGQSKLLIKRQYIHKSMPEPTDVIAQELKRADVLENGWNESNGRSDIAVESRLLSQRDMIEKIHAVGDVYFSASRGEGFDMPAYSAKIARRRVVTTDSGGPRDFLGVNDVLIPASGEVRVHPDYSVHGWEPSATYIDYDVQTLVETLKRVRNEPVRGDDWPREAFRASSIGTAVKKWLLSL